MKKIPPQIFERLLNMCRVLNIPEFWLFVNFRKYDRVLNMRRDATTEGFWILQDSECARLLRMHKVFAYTWIWLNNVLGQGSEYACSRFHSVLNQPPVLNMSGYIYTIDLLGLWICLIIWHVWQAFENVSGSK